MKKSSYLFNYASLDDLMQALEDQLYLHHFCVLNESHLNDVGTLLKRECDYITRVRRVLQHERELQTAHVCAVDPARFNPEDVLHLDCNVLRVWPDAFLDTLIPFYDFKSALSKDSSVYYYRHSMFDYAKSYKRKRRLYEQASIKLKRERVRRKRVYNLS